MDDKDKLNRKYRKKDNQIEGGVYARLEKAEEDIAFLMSKQNYGGLSASDKILFDKNKEHRDKLKTL